MRTSEEQAYVGERRIPIDVKKKQKHKKQHAFLRSGFGRQAVELL